MSSISLFRQIQSHVALSPGVKGVCCHCLISSGLALHSDIQSSFIC